MAFPQRTIMMSFRAFYSLQKGFHSKAYPVRKKPSFNVGNRELPSSMLHGLN